MTYTRGSAALRDHVLPPCGKSGLKLPALSLGLWHNFGDTTPLDNQRALLRTAFDLGITHFDLANNYGPPYGSAEINFGRCCAKTSSAYRDELIISTKAGWDMWPGPYGQGGGSRKYVLASLDQSLQRLGLDYVDIFYSHRFDADTPLEETMGALATAVQQGKALYVGISSYSAGKTREAVTLLREWKIPLLIHQPSYNMLNRWVEKDLLDTLAGEGVGCIAFTPLAQGLLTDKYLQRHAARTRASIARAAARCRPEHLREAEPGPRARAQRDRQARGQSLAQMALAWVLARSARDHDADRRQHAGADQRERRRAGQAWSSRADELAAIDRHAKEGQLNLWEKPSTDQRL